MKKFEPKIMFILMPLLVACGPQIESTDISPVVGNPPKAAKVRGNVNDIRAAAKAGELKCVAGQACNPAVVMLSVVGTEGLNRCTGFLISENEILTNDHCLKGSLTLDESEGLSEVPCQNDIFAHLVSLVPGKPGQTLACETIEYRSDVSGMASKDYTVIKLAASVTDRAPVRLATRGFKNLEAAKVMRVQMQEDGTQTGFNGVQSEVKCQTSFENFLYPNLDRADSPLMTFGECEIQAGNSGSPVFNEAGDVGAILQGYLLPENSEKNASELTAQALDGSFGRMAYGTQALCMPEVRSDRMLRGCPEIPSMLGYAVRDYLRLYGDPSDIVVPKTKFGQSWREVGTSDSLQKAYVKVSSFTGKVDASVKPLRFKLGINKFMQAEWRASAE